MEVSEIKNILQKNKRVLFSPNPKGLYYIEVDVPSLKVIFTTDAPGYKRKGLEDIIEEFYNQFFVTSFNINVHTHKAEVHDKNITLNLDKSEFDLGRIAEVVLFVMNQYQVDKWDYVTEK